MCNWRAVISGMDHSFHEISDMDRKSQPWLNPRSESNMLVFGLGWNFKAWQGVTGFDKLDFYEIITVYLHRLGERRMLVDNILAFRDLLYCLIWPLSVYYWQNRDEAASQGLARECSNFTVKPLGVTRYSQGLSFLPPATRKIPQNLVYLRGSYVP